MSMSNTEHLRVEAEEALAVTELSHSASAVAEELIERVVARFPRY